MKYLKLYNSPTDFDDNNKPTTIICNVDGNFSSYEKVNDGYSVITEIQWGQDERNYVRTTVQDLDVLYCAPSPSEYTVEVESSEVELDNEGVVFGNEDNEWTTTGWTFTTTVGGNPVSGWCAYEDWRGAYGLYVGQSSTTVEGLANVHTIYLSEMELESPGTIVMRTGDYYSSHCQTEVELENNRIQVGDNTWIDYQGEGWYAIDYWGDERPEWEGKYDVDFEHPVQVKTQWGINTFPGYLATSGSSTYIVAQRYEWSDDSHEQLLYGILSVDDGVYTISQLHEIFYITSAKTPKMRMTEIKPGVAYDKTNVHYNELPILNFPSQRVTYTWDEAGITDEMFNRYTELFNERACGYEYGILIDNMWSGSRMVEGPSVMFFNRDNVNDWSMCEAWEVVINKTERTVEVFYNRCM